MAFFKYLVLVAAVFCYSAVDAGRLKRAVTNCDMLKSCLLSVANQAGCGCQDQLQTEIDQFNACLSQNAVRDRCVQNRANYVCYNFNQQTCDDQAESCYDKYHEDFTDAEEKGFERCF